MVHDTVEKLNAKEFSEEWIMSLNLSFCFLCVSHCVCKSHTGISLDWTGWLCSQDKRQWWLWLRRRLWLPSRPRCEWCFPPMVVFLPALGAASSRNIIMCWFRSAESKNHLFLEDRVFEFCRAPLWSQYFWKQLGFKPGLQWHVVERVYQHVDVEHQRSVEGSPGEVLLHWQVMQ